MSRRKLHGVGDNGQIVRSHLILIGILNGLDESHSDALLPIDVQVESIDAIRAGACVPLVRCDLNGLNTRLDWDIASAHLVTAVLKGFEWHRKLVDVDYEVTPVPVGTSS